MTKRDDFEHWLSNGKSGTSFTYAVTNVLDVNTPPETVAVAERARQAFADGLIELVQKRTTPGDPFEYLAKTPQSLHSKDSWRTMASQHTQVPCK